MTTFGASPIPSQRIMSGRSAIFGIGYAAAMTGVGAGQTARETPSRRPSAAPTAAPRAKPIPTRARDTARWRQSSPLRAMRTASATTVVGAGRNRAGTQPSRATASQASTSSVSATPPMSHVGRSTGAAGVIGDRRSRLIWQDAGPGSRSLSVAVDARGLQRRLGDVVEEDAPEDGEGDSPASLLVDLGNEIGRRHVDRDTGRQSQRRPYDPAEGVQEHDPRDRGQPEHAGGQDC